MFLYDPGDETCKNGTLPKSRMVVRGGSTNSVFANYETNTYHHMRIMCLTTTTITKIMTSHCRSNCSVISFFEMKIDPSTPFFSNGATLWKNMPL